MEARPVHDGLGFQPHPLEPSRVEEPQDDEVGVPDPPCATHPELFFSHSVGEDGFPDERLETAEERSERIFQAKKLCLEECPYRFSCLLLSLNRKEKWGIWGGWERTDRRDFKIYLQGTGFEGYPTNEAELEWEVHFFEGTDPYLNGHGPRPIAWKYGASGLEIPSESLESEEDDD